MSKTKSERRDFLTMSGVGAAGMVLAKLASAQDAPSAAAGTAQFTAAEKANIELVHKYNEITNDNAAGVERFKRLKEICTPNMIFGRVNGDKFFGVNAMIEWYEQYVKDVETGGKGLKTIKYEYFETWAKGPVVAEYGLHFIQQPGGPPPPRNNYHVVVWVIRDGKLAERYDHSARREA